MPNIWNYHTIDDFSGGQTDLVTKPTKANQVEVLENLIPQLDGSIKIRPGIEHVLNLWDGSYVSQIIEHIWELQDRLVICLRSGTTLRFIVLDKDLTNPTLSYVNGQTDTPAQSGILTQAESYITGHVVNGEIILTAKPLVEGGLRSSIKHGYFNTDDNLVIETAQLPRVLNNHTGPVISVASGAGTNYSYVVEVYWKRTYISLINGEQIEKEIYGESTIETVQTANLLGAGSSIAVTFSCFQSSNKQRLTPFNIYDSDFSDDEVFACGSTIGMKLVIAVSDPNESVPYIRDYGNIYPMIAAANTYTVTLNSLPTAGAQTYTEIGEEVNSVLTQGPLLVTSAGDFTYYANIWGNPNRVYQSKPDSPYSVSLLSFVDFPYSVDGLNSYQNIPIVITKKGIHKINGSRSADGTGSLYETTISSYFGCIANGSVIETSEGIFFFSKQGIVYTDGVRAFVINEHLRNGKYQYYIATEDRRSKIKSFYDPNRNIVGWIVEYETWFYNFKMSQILILDLNFGISKESVFYIWNTARINNTMTGIFFSIYNGAIYGALSMHSLVEFKDENNYDHIVSGQESNQEYIHHIEYKIKTVSYNYGDPINRKWTSKIFYNLLDTEEADGVAFRNKIYPNVSNEGHDLEECIFNQRVVWDDNEDASLVENQIWGAIDPHWKIKRDLITFQRRLPSKSIRNNTMAIEIQNASVLKYTQEDFQTTTIYIQSGYDDGFIFLYDPNNIFTDIATKSRRYSIFFAFDDYFIEWIIYLKSVISGTYIRLYFQAADPKFSEITNSAGYITNRAFKIYEKPISTKFHLKNLILQYANMGNLSQHKHYSASEVVAINE